jgi:Ni/Co efflux regulator RcnB
MKRALTSVALASLMALGFAGPVAVAAATPAAAHDRGYRDYDDRGRHHDRGRHRGWDRRDRDYDNWDDRRDERRSYRDGYRDGRYSEGRHWRRGEYVPRYYWNDYRVVDYRRHHLRPPPRGYHYRYDDDRGEYLLVGIATGLILGVIAAR